jgi:nicotinamidase-related amidase/RimJ/RimL family protein N-acetyltransferase
MKRRIAMIILRKMTEPDIREIYRWPAYPGDMEQMDYALREQGWLDEMHPKADASLYAATDGDELIGFSLLARTGAGEAEFRIAVRADRTGQRLGETITMLTLRKGFAEMGLSRIHLIVRTNNNRGIRLYRRLGFTECGRCRKEIRGMLVDFLMMELTNAQGSQNQVLEKEKAMTQGRQRALLVIDVQNDYIGGNLPIEYPPVEQSLANIGRAMDGAKAAAIPVVVVQNILPENMPIMARGTFGAELHPSISERGWDHHVLKELPSAFTNTGLEEWLRTNNIDTITVAGYMTHNCDFSTVVHGLHSGFAVELLSDATGSVPYANRAGSATAEEIHRVMTVVMQSRFASVMTTDEWLNALAGGAVPKQDTIYHSNQRARKR